jgi:hypothetical protein
MRLLWICLAVCLLALAAVAQPPPPPPPDPTLGILRGMIICDDGLPFEGANGTVRCGDMALGFTTDKEGIFSVNIRAGEASVFIYGTTVKATVTAGKTATVQAQVKRPGCFVTITNADGTPYTGPVIAYARGKAFPWRMVNARNMGEGRYWFPEATTGTTSLGLSLPIGGNPGLNTPYTQVLTLPDGAAAQPLTMRLPTPRNLRVTIVDDRGQPLVNAAVTAKVSYLQSTPWSYEAGDRVNQVDRRYPPILTDEKGVLDLGVWPPMSFVLTARNGATGGPAMPGELKADGTCTLERYTLGFAPRTVKQTVYNAAGRAVPNAEVGISYCWAGRIAIKKERANADGVVTWANLPPVRAITWGVGVAPGVLPADAVNVATPLPRPVPGSSLQLAVTQPPPAAEQTNALFGMQSATVQNTYSFTLMPIPDGVVVGEAMLPSFTMQKSPQCGTPFSTGLLLSTAPPKLSLLLGAYMPYVDEEVRAVDFPLSELPMTSQEGVDATIRLVEGDKPVGDVSRIQLVPAAPQAWWKLFGEGGPRISGLEHPEKGVWRAFLPAAGTYRLLVDLYDADTPPVEALTLKLAAGKADATVTLPAPLFTLQSGTEVRWLPKFAPSRLHTLRVVNTAEKLAGVYGAPEALLTAWYVDGDKLQALVPGAKPAQRALVARKLRVMLKTADGSPVMYSANSGPLFPVDTRLYYAGDGDRRERPSNSDAISQYLSYYDREIRPYWAGKYPVLIGNTRSPQGFLEVPEVEQTEPVIVTVPAQTARSTATETGTRRVRYRFPAAEYEVLRRTSTSQVYFNYDVPFPENANTNGRGILQSSSLWEGDVLMLAPQTATKVSISWMGVGIIHNVPLPPAAATTPVVTLPAWQDGAVLGGVATANYTLLNTFGDESYTNIQRDTEGRFLLKGLPPGPVVLRGPYDNNTATLFVLPPAGLRDVRLPGSGETVYAMQYGGGATQTYWWLPDGGTPIELPHVRNWLRVRDLPDCGSGWLWYVDGRAGRTRMRRLLPEVGMGFDVVSAVGLIVPFDPARLPGAVCLTGTGALAGVTIDFPEAGWQCSSFVGVSTMTIDTVPPGTYTVRVETTTGPLEAPVTVTTAGGCLIFPAK